MKAGKIDINNLKELILDQISSNNQDVLVRPEIGEDSTVIDFGEFVAVMSSDPITGVQEGMGSLAVNVACNDIAANGAQPIGIQQVLLFPPTTAEEEITAIVKDINQAAQDLGIDILGGHTEITDIVKQPLVSCTAIGKTTKDNFVTSADAQIGDQIILTKWAGLEGTAILATDFSDQLSELGMETEIIEEAQQLTEYLSVIPEGLLGAELKVNAMHDVTEGGLYGSLFELAEAAEVGFEIEEDSVPLHRTTKKITQLLDINPYQLIGSGAMLLTAVEGEKVVDKLTTAGINATTIGEITAQKRVVVTEQGEIELNQAPQDELWRFLAEN
ncbi:AIR synthase family protein [Natroniella sulfidigena]|uniref:AIR synthase family protein n=1 Tax=Natroniella sulfidigena TaxID=723921 RepID=UPI00200B0DB6|nr:AIR synthase family protein [Natroniella sulfidigena]MCK8817263.1 AIR synthase family protein [Natroniella sulfidigena]